MSPANPISFEFDFQRAIQAMAYIVDKLGGVDKAKLTKLLYIADREHFLRYGRPITGDDQVAMPYGPLPSHCLDLLNCEFQESEELFTYLHFDNHRILLESRAGTDALNESDITILDEVIEKWGHKQTWGPQGIVEATHRFPEYIEVFVEDTSKPLPYEVILQHHASKDQRDRRGRPLVTRAMASHMVNPFQNSEPDL